MDRCAPRRGRLNVWYSSQRFTMRSNESSGVWICTALNVSSQKRSVVGKRRLRLDQGGITSCQLGRMWTVPSLPEDERHDCELAGLDVHHELQRATWVKPSTSASRELIAEERRRRTQRAVPSDELATITGVRSWCRRRSPERHTLAELRV